MIPKCRTRSRVALLIVVAAVAASAGCAAHGTSLSSRFVKPGDPDASYDDPNATPPPRPPELSAAVRKTRALQSKAVPKNSLLPTIESTNPEIARQLLLLTLHETAERHRLTAVAYRNAGVLDYAYRHFQRATVLDACDVAAYDGLARLWRDWGMPDLALGEIQRALRCKNKSAELYNTLGTVFETLGRPVEATRAYESALGINPRATFALNNLCYVHMTQGDGMAALRYCEAALDVDPAFGPARTNLALLDAKRGDLAGAERRLRDGVPTATALYNIGVLRLSEGRYAEAAVVFDQATATQPSLTIARQRSVQARQAARAAEQTR